MFNFKYLNTIVTKSHEVLVVENIFSADYKAKVLIKLQLFR